MLVTLYKSLIRPHLEYGNAVWHPFLRKDINSIESVQRSATKLCIEIKELSYIDRLKAMKLPTLVYRRRRGDMIQVYKIVHGLEDVPIDSFFELNDDTRTRGHNYKLRKIRAVKRRRQCSFTFRVVNDWNSLPANVVNAKDINQFKSLLDECWRKHQLDM